MENMENLLLLQSCFMSWPPIGPEQRAGFLTLSLYQAGEASQDKGAPTSPFSMPLPVVGARCTR